MVKLTQLPHEDYETWVDTPDAEQDAARIETGIRFRALDDHWYDDVDPLRRVIRRVEFV